MVSNDASFEQGSGMERMLVADTDLIGEYSPAAVPRTSQSTSCVKKLMIMFGGMLFTQLKESTSSSRRHYGTDPLHLWAHTT